MEPFYLSPSSMGSGDKVLPMIGSKMPQGQALFKESEPEKEQSEVLEIVHTDVFYTDKNGKRYLLSGVVAKEV